MHSAPAQLEVRRLDVKDHTGLDHMLVPRSQERWIVDLDSWPSNLKRKVFARQDCLVVAPQLLRWLREHIDTCQVAPVPFNKAANVEPDFVARLELRVVRRNLSE